MKFSIVTICYNSANTIGRTMRSVAHQDFDDYEHIIIDGASKDTTMDIVSQYQTSRTHAISEPDKGIYNAMNKGLDLAQGDYTLFLNSDDFLASPRSLSAMGKFADNANSDILIGQTDFYAPQSSLIPRRRYRATSDYQRLIKYGIMPPHPSTFVRTRLLKDIGGFDERYKISSDFDLFARLFLTRNVTISGLAQTITRFAEGGVSTSELIVPAITQDIIRSLESQNIPFAKQRIKLRYLYKISQYIHGTSPDNADWMEKIGAI